jgi:glycosyltransferase involved in cell wall biosynthesis
LAGKKTIVTVQGLDWQRRKWGWLASRVLRWGEAAAVTFPNATLVVSHTLRHYFQQRYGRSTIYVPNGASTLQPAASTRVGKWNLQPDHYVLFLGRFSPEKNCHLLIEAFERVRTTMKLVLAGGSSHSDAYVEELRRHESNRIRFLPWTSGEDLAQLLSNAALFVLPSDLEGLSLALLDAMAAGICVLTSDIPENNEVVSGAGYTFHRGDGADLERMLDLLIRNPELRREAAQRAQERIQAEYAWPAIARQIEKAYYGVLGRNPAKDTGESANGDSAADAVPLGHASIS